MTFGVVVTGRNEGEHLKRRWQASLFSERLVYAGSGSIGRTPDWTKNRAAEALVHLRILTLSQVLARLQVLACLAETVGLLKKFSNRLLHQQGYRFEYRRS